MRNKNPDHSERSDISNLLEQEETALQALVSPCKSAVRAGSLSDEELETQRQTFTNYMEKATYLSLAEYLPSRAVRRASSPTKLFSAQDLNEGNPHRILSALCTCLPGFAIPLFINSAYPMLLNAPAMALYVTIGSIISMCLVYKLINMLLTLKSFDYAFHTQLDLLIENDNALQIPKESLNYYLALFRDKLANRNDGCSTKGSTSHEHPNHEALDAIIKTVFDDPSKNTDPPITLFSQQSLRDRGQAVEILKRTVIPDVISVKLSNCPVNDWVNHSANNPPPEGLTAAALRENMENTIIYL